MLKQPKINPRHVKMFCPAVQRERHQTLTSKKVKIQLLIFQMDLISLTQ